MANSYGLKVVSEKVQIAELSQNRKKASEIQIPDYLPKNKYIAFVNDAIAAIGDSVSEVSQSAVSKYPHYPIIIKFNGPKPKPQEYVYMSLKSPHSWNYLQFFFFIEL